jgi:hypothetical protein
MWELGGLSPNNGKETARKYHQIHFLF